MKNKNNDLKNNLKTWLTASFLTLILYDMVWLLMNVDDIAAYEGLQFHEVILTDFVYCLFFSFFAGLVSTCILRLNLEKYFKRIRAVKVGVVMFVVNMAVAYIIEVVSNGVIHFVPEEEFLNDVYIMGLISSAISLIYVMERHMQFEEKANAEKLALQTKVLRTQLNPHFLYNSLSVLAGFISIDPQKAEKFTVKLSRIYRYILKNIDEDLTTIDSAVSFASDYMELLKLRYDNVDFEKSGLEYNSDEYILAFCLQPLIENAIKHSDLSKSNHLTIKLRRKGDYLYVSNDKLPIVNSCSSSFSESFGIGLSNLKKRSLIITGRKLLVNENAETFEIGIPIVEKGEGL